MIGNQSDLKTDRILDRFEQIKKENQDIRVVILMNQGVYIDMVIGSVLQNLVDSEDLKHPDLEIVFTVKEEVGLIGADPVDDQSLLQYSR